MATQSALREAWLKFILFTEHLPITWFSFLIAFYCSAVERWLTFPLILVSFLFRIGLISFAELCEAWTRCLCAWPYKMSDVTWQLFKNYHRNQTLVTASLLVLALTAHMSIVCSLDIHIPHSLAHLFTQKHLLRTWSILLHLTHLFYKIFLHNRSEKWKPSGTVDEYSVSSNGGFLIERDETIYRTELAKVSALPKWHLVTHGNQNSAVRLTFLIWPFEMDALSLFSLRFTIWCICRTAWFLLSDVFVSCKDAGLLFSSEFPLQLFSDFSPVESPIHVHHSAPSSPGLHSYPISSETQVHSLGKA